MAYIRMTPSRRFTARVRVKGYPSISRTFRTRRDAWDWARFIEDDMVRGVYQIRGVNEPVGS